MAEPLGSRLAGGDGLDPLGRAGRLIDDAMAGAIEQDDEVTLFEMNAPVVVGDHPHVP